MTFHRSAILRSILVTGAAYFAAQGVERAFVRAVGASTGELLGISDVVLSLVLGLVTYLWLHLRATRSTLSRLEREQIVLNTQLTVATDIQQRLLAEPPLPRAGVSWAARLQPAGKIGGDFYDFVELADGSVLMLVGDIFGKGIPAALLLAFTCAIFRTVARETGDPAELTRRLSDALYADNHGSPYATCLLGAFDLRGRTLTYVNAGHPPGLIVCPSGRRLLEPTGPPAGMFPAWPYVAASVPLDERALGVVVTDGVTEALENDGRAPLDAVEAAVRRLRQPSAEVACDEVMGLVEGGSRSPGIESWQDDRTVVVFIVEPRA